jgi:hypothetical protein
MVASQTSKQNKNRKEENEGYHQRYSIRKIKHDLPP